MFVPIDELSSGSRIWIYQADRQLSEDEIKVISEASTNFCSGWKAHNQTLSASFTIKYDRFVIIAVDEEAAKASGCSIDSSVHFITQLGNQLSIDFLNRSQIAFLIGNEVKIYPLVTIKEKIAEGEVKADDLIFNNNILYKNELNTSWLVPVKQSWAKKYLKTTAV